MFEKKMQTEMTRIQTPLMVKATSSGHKIITTGYQHKKSPMSNIGI